MAPLTSQRSPLRSPVFAALAVGVIVSAATELARHFGVFQALELQTYDAYVRHRPVSPQLQAPIALVIVSETDIQTLGTWPLPDEALARAIQILTGYRARAVGVDIFRDTPVPPGRAELDQVLTANRNVVVVYRFNTESEVGVSAPPALKDTPQMGFNDVIVDPGGIVRRAVLFLTANREGADGAIERFTGYSFALRLASLYLQADGIRPAPDPDYPERMRLGPTTVVPLEPRDGSYAGIDASGYQFLLDYRHSSVDFPRYRITDLLSGKLKSENFEDNVVLIGTTAISVPDLLYTPFSLGLRTDQQTPGVVLHAHAVDQLIRFGRGQSQTFHFLPAAVEGGWVLMWGLTGALAGTLIASAQGAFLVAFLGLGLLIGVTFVAFIIGWWIPVIAPAAAWLLSATLVTAYKVKVETSQRRLLMNLFSRHVDPQLAELVWDQREKFLQGGRPSSEALTATVMFTDLHGFTTTSEKLSPGDLMEWLNDYMQVMTPLVMEHGGVILRFIGDAIMAVFGAPLARTSPAEVQRDACNAVRCALTMQRRLREHNRVLQARGLPMIGMRIGIYTGEMVGGSLGDRHRLEYNLHGDSVNIAARLESYDKASFEPDFLDRPCRIFIGQATLTQLDGQFSTARVGEVTVKGKGRKVLIHRVLDEIDGLGDTP